MRPYFVGYGQRDEDSKERVKAFELADRGAGIAGTPFNVPYFRKFKGPNAFFTITGEPYTAASTSKFLLLRSRIVGGRTDHCARIALCFAKGDWTRRPRERMEGHWPITYEDLPACFFTR
jgi:hypothetical protein